MQRVPTNVTKIASVQGTELAAILIGVKEIVIAMPLLLQNRPLQNQPLRYLTAQLMKLKMKVGTKNAPQIQNVKEIGNVVILVSVSGMTTVQRY